MSSRIFQLTVPDLQTRSTDGHFEPDLIEGEPQEVQLAWHAGRTALVTATSIKLWTNNALRGRNELFFITVNGGTLFGGFPFATALAFLAAIETFAALQRSSK